MWLMMLSRKIRRTKKLALKKMKMGSMLLVTVCFLPFYAGAREIPAEYAHMQNMVTLDAAGMEYWKEKYLANCGGCHGADGDAAKQLKRQYTPEQIKKMGLVIPADLTDKKYMDSRSDGALFYQIGSGGEDESYMPGFGPESDIGWSERKVWGMVAYIRTLSQSKDSGEEYTQLTK